MAWGVESYSRHDDTWMSWFFDRFPEIGSVEFDIDVGKRVDLTFYWVENSTDPWSYRELLPHSELRLALEELLDG